MKDITTYIKRKYFQLLKPELAIPVFIDYVPNQLSADAYVLITSPSSVGTPTFNSDDTDTTVQLGIYTKDKVANNDDIAGTAAQVIFDTICPDQSVLLDLTAFGFDKCGVDLVNDVTPEAIQTDSEIFINRFITFRHNIQHS